MKESAANWPPQMEESPGWGRRRGGTMMEGDVGYMFRASLKAWAHCLHSFMSDVTGGSCAHKGTNQPYYSHPLWRSSCVFCRCSPLVSPFFSSLLSQIIRVIIRFSSLAVSILHPTSLVAVPLFPLSEPITKISSSPEKRLSESEEMQTSPVRRWGWAEPRPRMFEMCLSRLTVPLFLHI